MQHNQLNQLTSFIWNIADDVLRDLYLRGKYRDVILPDDGPAPDRRCPRAGKISYRTLNVLC